MLRGVFENWISFNLLLVFLVCLYRCFIESNYMLFNIFSRREKFKKIGGYLISKLQFQCLNKRLVFDFGKTCCLEDSLSEVAEG
mgnify:CR=1 FL=1